MKAIDIFAAIRRTYKDAALVPEVVINDFDYREGELDPNVRPVPQRRIDALMFQSLERTAIEIKVDRADLKREHSGKWGPWVRVSHRFVYAIPEGMATMREVLDATGLYSAGLWLVSPDGKIKVARKCSINKHPEPLPLHVIQALAYRATPKDVAE